MLAHRQLRGLTGAALAASLALHGAVGAVISQAFIPSGKVNHTEVVELAVVQPPLPPPPEPRSPPQSPQPPVPSPKRAIRAKPVVEKSAPPPSVAPPEPQQPPSEPVVGVTPDTVVDDPAAMALPQGNTLAAPVAATSTAPPPTSYVGGAVGGTGMAPFAPVAEGFVKQWPRTLSEVRAPYPEEARRLQMSGTVRLRVGIDETGKVREVKVIKRAGFGLDEAASAAMWRFKFSPAMGQNGQPVAFRIHYDYTFTPGR